MPAKGLLICDKDFLKLWTGQTVSELGSHITRDGLPLVGVLTLNAAPAQMGALAAAGALPVLLFGLVAGVWVDRLRRRRLMIAVDLGRAVLLMTIPLAAIMGRLAIRQLYAVVILSGVLTVFFDVAYRAYLPSLIGRADLTEGNAKLALTGELAEVLGSGLAGVLVQALTAPVAMFLDALSFLVSVVSLAFIRKREPPPRPAAVRQHAGREVWHGLQFVWRQPLLRTFAGVAAIRSFFGYFYAALYSLYAIRVLGLGPAALGFAIAMGGAGGILGALLVERLNRRYSVGRVLIGTQVVGMCGGLLTVLARGPVPLATAMLMLSQLTSDGAGSIYAINQISVRQTVTPDRLLGRVNASSDMLPMAAAPFGALVGGILGGLIGVRNTLWIAELSSLITLAWLALSPVRSLRELPPPAEPPELVLPEP